MFGMIKNSLFGGVELNNGTLIQKQEKITICIYPANDIKYVQELMDAYNQLCFTDRIPVRKDGMTFEERTYDGGNFAAVEVADKPFDEASKECVLKLLKYVGGSNDKGAGMGMTSPVAIISYPTEEESLQPKVKVILRIPSQFQADPPVPTDDDIHIEKRERLNVYAMQFGGYAKETDYVSHAEKLRSCLGPEASYHKDYYICCGYDPPMKPYGRRNEVWFVKND